MILSLVQSLFTAPVLVNSNAPKILPELELKLSKLMAETKVLADGYSPTPSDIDSLRKKIAELQSTVDLDDCELEDGDLRSLNIGKFARATQKQLHEMIYPFGYGRRVRREELTVIEPRSEVEPAEVVPVRLPVTLPLSDPASWQACEYLSGRGFDPFAIEAHWGVGYCQNSPNSEPRIFNRLAIPIHAVHETVCTRDSTEVYLAGWQAREIFDGGGSSQKYLSMKGMRKSQLLYGLPKAIESEGPVVVVEGVTDVWRLEANCVAAFGKMLHPSQIALVIRHFSGRPLVVFFDADAHEAAVVTAHQIRVKRREWGDSSPVVLATPQNGHGDVADCGHATAWNCVRNALLKGALNE